MPASLPLHDALADGVSIRAADLLRRQHERGLADHAMAVARLTIATCRTLGLATEETAAFARAALFHDAGKLEIPAHILDRPTALNDVAWALIRTHPARGERLTRAVPELRDIAPIVRHHHERWDGVGYPDGLAGEEIPLGGRVVLAGDAFDAMTSKRSYRPTRGRDAAWEEMRAGAGTQFDPVVAAAVVDTVISSDRFIRGSASNR